MNNDGTNTSISKEILPLNHSRMYKEKLMGIKEMKRGKKFSRDLENN